MEAKYTNSILRVDPESLNHGSTARPRITSSGRSISSSLPDVLCLDLYVINYVNKSSYTIYSLIKITSKEGIDLPNGVSVFLLCSKPSHAPFLFRCICRTSAHVLIIQKGQIHCIRSKPEHYRRVSAVAEVVIEVRR